MQRVLIIVFLAISITACKSSKHLNQLNKAQIELIVPKTVKQNDIINFKLINNSANKIIVHNPAFKNIERLEAGKWVKVKILYCPCGADCIPPPKTKTINTSQNYSYSWNLIESWCDKKKSNNIPKTKEHKSAVGTYRTTVYYSLNGTDIKNIVKEFKIIN